MKRNQLSLLIISCSAVAASSVAVALEGPHVRAAERPVLAAATLVMMFFLGACLLLVRGLAGFASQLKRSLMYYFVGYALFGVTQMVLPLLNASGQLNSHWPKLLLVIPPFIAAMWVLTLGAFDFRKLFKIDEFTPPAWLEWPPPFVLAVAFGLLPHSHVVLPTWGYMLLNAFLFWNAHILLLSALFLNRIKKTLGAQYTQALAWLVIAVIVMSLTTYLYLAGVAFVGDRRMTSLPLASLCVLLGAGLLLMRSAYAFGSILYRTDVTERTAQRNFFGKPISSPAAHASRSIDIVMYAANLVSVPTAIDETLDQVRYITSRPDLGAQLSPQDQQLLLQVYLQIEDYLAHHETARSFTPESLREEITRKLHLESTPDTFWNMLPLAPQNPAA